MEDDSTIKFYQTGTFTVGNRLLPRTSARCRPTCSARTRSIPGTARARAAAKRSARATRSTRRCARRSNQLIAVNATGCLEVFSTPYPGDVVADSLDPLAVRQCGGGGLGRRRGACARQGRTDVRVIAQGGDGGTTDIGFGCLSGMFERNDDVLYICYDNEAYMNTGVQRSSATPPAARTATTPAIGREPGNVFGTGKNVPLHRDGARHSLRRDRERRQPARPRAQGHARDGDPRRALHSHLRALPARLGLGARGHDQDRAAGRRVGAVPAVRGAWTARSPAARRSGARCRSPNTCKLQKRFAHLFGKAPDHGAHRADPGDRRPQHRRVRLARLGDAPWTSPLRSRSTSARASPTRPARGARPGRSIVDRLPPCNHACPAGENIQGWLYHAEGGDYEAAWRALTEDNPLPAIMGRVCYHPCESACNRGKLDEAVGINSVERFLGDEAIKRGWKFAPPRARCGKRVLIVGAGPVGPFGGVSPAPAGPSRHDRRGGSAAPAA